MAGIASDNVALASRRAADLDRAGLKHANAILVIGLIHQVQRIAPDNISGDFYGICARAAYGDAVAFVRGNDICLRRGKAANF